MFVFRLTQRRQRTRSHNVGRDANGADIVLLRNFYGVLDAPTELNISPEESTFVHLLVLLAVLLSFSLPSVVSLSLLRFRSHG